MPEFTNTRDEIGEQAALDGLVGRTLTEYNEDENILLRPYAFYENKTIASVAFPNVTGVNSAGYQFQNATALQSASFARLQIIRTNMFSGCASLQTISFPVATQISTYAFWSCSALQQASFPEVTQIGAYAFDSCSSLSQVSFPKATSVESNAFNNAPIVQLVLPVATSLGGYCVQNYGAVEIDLSATPVSIPANAFSSGYNLTALILRSNTMIPLAGTGCFTGTPIAAGYGWIYVPDSLVSTYKAASNWATYASQIVSLNEYPKALPCETISDSWSEIFAAEANNTHSTKYSIGDTKLVDVGGIPVLMQIAAFDADALDNGLGTAKITWICKGVFRNNSMNATATTLGGWKDCALRSWLRDSIYPKIDSTVRSNIKTVTKQYRDVASNGTNTTRSVGDTIWIPSGREVLGGSSLYESEGVIYSGLFTNNTSRQKKPGMTTTTTAASWQLRSAYTTSNFFYISGNNGGNNNGNANNSYGVVFGFCT